MQRKSLLIESVRSGTIAALVIVPLLLVLKRAGAAAGPLITGAYDVAVDSLALPCYFGDTPPWQVDRSTIYPSLIGHVVFGTSIGRTSRRFVAGARR